MERDLRAQKSKVEERLAMTEAKTEDGGLVLGTGLDFRVADLVNVHSAGVVHINL